MDRIARLTPLQEGLAAAGLVYAVLFVTLPLQVVTWAAYAAFLYAPVGFAWLRGRDFAEYGLFMRDPARTAVAGLGSSAVILGLFAGGYVLLVNATELPLPWGPGFFEPWPVVLRFAVGQVLVVAVAEEFFYRGYLQDRFDAAWRPRWRILGATLGPGWLIANLLFAVGHLADGFNPARLLTFFPGLWYGWCRARSGNIYAGVAAHGLSNLVIAFLQGQDIAPPG